MIAMVKEWQQNIHLQQVVLIFALFRMFTTRQSIKNKLHIRDTNLAEVSQAAQIVIIVMRT